MMWILESMLIGLVGGLFGLFYRNVEKGKNMLLNRWFFFVLQPMAFSKWGILRFLARPLGYCVYCSTFWITFILYLLYTGLPIAGYWQMWVIGLVAAEGIQHILLLLVMENVIEGSKDFDPKIWTIEDDEPDVKKRVTVKGFTKTETEEQVDNNKIN